MASGYTSPPDASLLRLILDRWAGFLSAVVRRRIGTAVPPRCPRENAGCVCTGQKLGYGRGTGGAGEGRFFLLSFLDPHVPRFQTMDHPYVSPAILPTS